MEFEDGKIINENLEGLKKKGGDFVRTNLILLLTAFVIVYLLSGFFIVQQYELGVVRRFGKLNRIVDPGLRYHLPFPVERVDRPSVLEVRRMEVGYRTKAYHQNAVYQDEPKESNMLTGDINIVSTDFIIQYKINAEHPEKYLFNVYNMDDTIKKAAEATMRQVAASHKIDDILTEEKENIQLESKELLQRILDSYDCGIIVQAVKLQDVVPPKEVVAAFKDVASAKEDKEKYINQANGYLNELIPKAKGEAAKLQKAAEGYRQEKINLALGEAERFLKVLEEYKKAPDITRRRLYLETSGKTFSRCRKIISSDQTGGDLIKLFHLPDGGEK